MPPTILDLQHVSVARGDQTVLHDISLTLHAGEHLAILGPNGCGKSTLLKTITCELYPLVHPPSGIPPHVSIFGRQRWDLTVLRRRMGLVAPDLPGKPTLTTTGFDSVLTAFFSASALWPNLTVTDRMREQAHAALAEVDALPLATRLVGEMSAGQQRRVMIARALVGSRSEADSRSETSSRSDAYSLASRPSQTAPGDSAMLLLDEPSNALDLAAQRHLRDLLRTLAQRGTSILLITHQVSDIIPEIGRVLLMREGRILADGPRADLLTAPTLSDLFQTPVHLTEFGGLLHAW